MSATIFPNNPNSYIFKTAGKYVKVYNKGLGVQYKGPGQTERHASSVRTNNSIPMNSGIFYYEVEIISKGKDGYIGVGFSIGNINLERLVGWDEESYGYHGDDGNVFIGSGIGKKFGPTFSTGDIIGCGYNILSNKIFFTKNAIYIGDIPRKINNDSINEKELFPTVGMRTQGEKLVANFGKLPFVFDYKSLIISEMNLRYYKISPSVPIIEYKTVGLVAEYLSNQGYSSTALAIIEQVKKEQENQELFKEISILPNLVSLELRNQLCNHILNSKTKDAIEIIRKDFPGLLDESKYVYFQLKCQVFIDLIKNNNIDAAFEYAQNELEDFEDVNGEKSRILSLLAYPNADNSPVAHLLSEERRRAVASSVNELFLLHTHNETSPSLNSVVKHLAHSMNILSKITNTNIYEVASIPWIIPFPDLIPDLSTLKYNSKNQDSMIESWMES